MSTPRTRHVPLLLFAVASVISPLSAGADTRAINADAAGISISGGLRGQNPYRNSYSSPQMFNVSFRGSVRGPAGGLDADTYDWRDVNSGVWYTGPQYTTLEFLRMARDRHAEPLFTANVIAGGSRDASGQYNCSPAPASTAAALAADWVRYTNYIIRTYRTGQTITNAGDARIVNSITGWGSKAVLPKLEGCTPKVRYWEIGNEPEMNIPGFIANHILSSTTYRDRYLVVSQAMTAVDPDIKVGPCIVYPTSSGSYLSALAASSAKINFISYHPYYYALQNAWGNVASMESALRGYKGYLKTQSDAARTKMTQYNRTGVELIASEWNPFSWDASADMNASMAMAISTAEGIFSFAQESLTAANFWEDSYSKASTYKLYQYLQRYMGNCLIDSYSDGSNFRMYTTKYTPTGRIIVWGLNFSDSTDKSMVLSFSGRTTVKKAVIYTLGVSGGDTSLMSASGVAWSSADITDGFNLAGQSIVFQVATVTVLVLDAK